MSTFLLGLAVFWFTSEEKGSSKILNLRLFCLERFVTRWAVKAVVQLSILSFFTVFAYEKEANSKNPTIRTQIWNVLANYMSLVTNEFRTQRRNCISLQKPNKVTRVWADLSKAVLNYKGRLPNHYFIFAVLLLSLLRRLKVSQSSQCELSPENQMPLSQFYHKAAFSTDFSVDPLSKIRWMQTHL